MDAGLPIVPNALNASKIFYCKLTQSIALLSQIREVATRSGGVDGTPSDSNPCVALEIDDHLQLVLYLSQFSTNSPISYLYNSRVDQILIIQGRLFVAAFIE